MTDTHFSLQPIAYISSPFKEKFGLPRQPGLISSITASINMHTPYDQPDAFRGIEQFSHLWLTFGFHQNDHTTWRPLIRPPRLGGNEKLGVFASRSSFRPNGLGLSVVKLIKLHTKASSCSLEIACPDLLDGTPIFDIKPYIAYADAIPAANSGFASSTPPKTFKVMFSDSSLNDLERLYHATTSTRPPLATLKAFINECLAYDPRPAYKRAQDDKQYGIRLYDLNILWRVDRVIIVDAVSLASD